MNNFINKHSKAIIMIFGILAFIALLSALVFMTQYRYIRVNYTLTTVEDYEKSLATATEGGYEKAFGILSMGGQYIKINATANLNGAQQQVLFDFFDECGFGTYNDFAAWAGFQAMTTKVGSTYRINDEVLTLIFNYKKDLDAFNDLIVIFAVVSLVCFALLLVFGNQSRKIYYKSNLIGGIVFPLVTVVFGVIMVVKLMSLMSTLNENLELFNVVSVLQNAKNAELARGASAQAVYDQITGAYSVNAGTFIAYIVIFAFIIVYALFVILAAIMKYKGTGKERQQVLEKAGAANGQ